jgi:hypothetical protein
MRSTENVPAADWHRLQARLESLFGGRPPSELEDVTIVVLPSITFPSEELRKITAIEHYEERLFCLALWLRNPSIRVVYLSSIAIEESVVDYYLSFLPDGESARRRLRLFSLGDPEPRSLSEKLLGAPSAIDEIRKLVRAPKRAFILPFNVTEYERQLSMALNIPIYGPAPELVPLGTKSGSREVARRAGVPVLPGEEDLFSIDEISEAITGLQKMVPGMRTAVVKLNNGFSGQGNAILDLGNLRSPLSESPTIFCAEEETWTSYQRKIEAGGAIVEQLARDPSVVSPSVQLRISPGRPCEVLSTHDQVLGGPDDQVYLGCRFPAGQAYRDLIQGHALRVGEVLESEGVIGSFGIDFIVLKNGGGWQAFLSEINLRIGGTTHPFYMAQQVTNGRYETGAGELIAGGQAKNYFASDNLKSSSYKGMKPEEVLRAVRIAGLAFNHESGTGVTLHLLGALEGYGKLGALCIANEMDDAIDLYESLEDLLDVLGSSGRGELPEL